MADGTGILGADEFGSLKDFLAIDTPFEDGEVVLTSLDGEDALSRCFVYEVSVVTKQHGAQMESLVGEPVTLWLTAGGAGNHRPINGHVRRVRGIGRSPRGGRRFLLEVVPRLWFLSCTLDCRIFQHMNVPDIIRQVFDDHGLRDFKFRFNEAEYPALEYCVQYRESALDFVSRLMEHLGLFYWHEHEAGRHVLVIGASNRATGKCEPYELHFNPHSELGELQTMELDSAFRPGKWTLNDYDFESPTKQLLVDTPTLSDTPRMVDHEIYEYPGAFNDPDEGRQLTRLRIEMEEAQHRRVSGTGSFAGFDPGKRFQVETADHSHDTYLLTEVRHRAKWSGRENAGTDEDGYANEYVAIPARSEFRPERVTPRPFIRGTQTATVVGPAGDNIYCDEYGRVRLQFHWDRRGRQNEHSSCWVRVAQARSGSYYGNLVIPHVGHEVLVSFIEGDPNRPLITGTVPNAMMMPPVPLPLDKNKTVQRDHGDNKIVMHGKAGKEYVSLSSPKTVNMFASRHHARPLSSDTPYSFYSDPTSASDPTQGQGTQVTVDGFQDSVGLQQLYSHWYGVSQADIGANNSEMTTDANAFPNAQDGQTDDGSYINSGSEGRSNFLTLGNNNTWVYANSNTWVNGSAATQVNQNSYTTIGGSYYGGNNSSVTSSLEVFGTNNTLVHGDNITKADQQNYTEADTNITLVHGDNSQVVLGANDALTLGTNDTLNMGLNTQINFLLNLAYCITDNVQINQGWNMQYNSPMNLSINDGITMSYNTGIVLDVGDVEVKTYKFKQKDVLTEFVGSGIKISSLELEVKT